MLGDQAQMELVAMSEAILKKLSGFFDVSDDISKMFREICTSKVDLEAGKIIVPQGGDYENVYLVESGWVTRSRFLDSGARQIVNVALAGDFVAMNAMLFSTSDFELRCKTDVSAFKFSGDELGATLSSDPMLAAALFWVNAHEESLLAERIVSLGRRSARQRTAHVLCEFLSRLEVIGVENLEEVIIPLSQDEFSDILGISIVHMNKTLRALARDGILTFRNSLLVVLDRGKLEAEAGFDGGYLHFTRREDRSAWHPKIHTD